VIALIFGYSLAGAFLVLSLFGRKLVVRRIAQSDEEGLRDLRRVTESTWSGHYLAVLAFLCATGATFLLVRGHLIGIGWWGVAIVYIAAFFAQRRRRAFMLDLIGDRGKTIRSTRNERRLQLAGRFATVGVLGYVTIKVLQYAYPEPVPDGAAVAIGAVGIMAFIAVAGWLLMRTLVYLSLDDDKEAARRESAN
jgi:hypothetical protein